MISPGRATLNLYRWQPNVVTIDFVGQDFTGATFKSEIRAFVDAPDPALVSLTNKTAGTQGISVSVATTDGVTTSTVTLQYDEATIEGLPFTNPRGTDFEAVWDLVVDTPADIKTRWLEGPCIVHGGSTQI